MTSFQGHTASAIQIFLNSNTHKLCNDNMSHNKLAKKSESLNYPKSNMNGVFQMQHPLMV